jgi:hypothetical protein
MMRQAESTPLRKNIFYSSIRFHFVRVSSGPVTKGKSALGYGGLSMTMWHVDLAEPHEPRGVVPGVIFRRMFSFEYFGPLLKLDDGRWLIFPTNPAHFS